MPKAKGQTAAPATAGVILHGAHLYDLVAWLFLRGKERAFREKVIDLSKLSSGESVLDVGCGTGTLAIAAKRRAGPEGVVCGIDPAPEMIARAQRKAGKLKVDVSFQISVIEKLPFPDGHFDVVLSTLMLHHLPKATREQGASEIRRVLKPNGRWLIVDFVEAEQRRKGILGRFHFRHGHIKASGIDDLLKGAGFQSIASGALGLRNMSFFLAKR
jgi:ubiquinone/menaquinone biosynthesis C-methylase UbiE